MVKGQLIPSISYKTKQTKIYNRYKIEEGEEAKELITFPSKDGPLKLPNVALPTQPSNDAAARSERATITLEVPEGKRNLETYLKTLQFKHNLADLVSKSKPDDQSDQVDDPRSLADLVAENKDLQDQFVRQFLNLENYL